MPPIPAWTDENDAGPGVTLLELFAFLTTGYLVMNGLGPLLERAGLARPVTTISVHGEPWRQVDALAGTGPDDRVYRLDPTTGKVEFGDGAQGRRPTGSVETSNSYRYGAGAAGLVGVFVIGCGLWTASIWRRWRRSRRREVSPSADSG